MASSESSDSQKNPRKIIGSKYEVLEKVGEGTFGEVFRARHLENKDLIVALKRIILPYEQQPEKSELRKKQEKSGIPLITFRELKILKLMQHENVMPLLNVILHSEIKSTRPKIYFVFPFMDHDLAGLIDNKDVELTPAVVKCYFKQLLKGVRYLHFNNFIHRDLKPANLLLKDGVLKITDFGLARPVDLGLYSHYTPNVVTRWYRAPELCLQSATYNTKIDVWSCGCILAELLLRRPLFPGTSDLEQIHKIFEVIGTPGDMEWLGWRRFKGSEMLLDAPILRCTIPSIFDVHPESVHTLLKQLLSANPTLRISADEALDSEYMWEDPLPALPSQLPKYESSFEWTSEEGKKRREAIEKWKQRKKAKLHS